MYSVSFTDNDFIVSDSALATRPTVESPDDAYDILVGLDWAKGRESCWVLSLDTKHRLIAADLSSIGSVDKTFMVPRDILMLALGNSASAIVVAHNHPSGDPTPSMDDQKVTRRLHEACRIIGIELLDSLVIGHPTSLGWTSLARRGVI